MAAEALSTAAWTIRENNSTIAGLKQQNQDMRAQLNERKPPRRALQVEQSIQHVRSMIDKAVQQKRLAVSQLNKVVNDLYSSPRDDSLSRESKAALKTIRGLENRLDKAYMRHNEAASIRMMYQQLVITLRQDRDQAQGQLQAAQDAVKRHAAELDRALIDGREAAHRKELAKLGLQQAEQSLAARRAAREKQLQQKRQACLQSADAGPSLPGSSPDSSSCSKDAALSALCHTLRVSTPADLPYKVAAQKQTLEELGRALEAAEQAVSSLAGQRAGLQQQVAELQAGGHQRTQATIDRLKAQQQEAAVELEESKEAMEQVTQGLVEVQAGVQHLGAMTAVLQAAGGRPPSAAASDASLLDALARMQACLQAAQALIKQYPASEAQLQSLIASVDY